MRSRFRLIYLAPALVMIALLAWVFASPMGSAPDDDFQLASIWCANGARTDLCQPGPTENSRIVPAAVHEAPCYAYDADKSAGCQLKEFTFSPKPTVTTTRVNTDNQYPPVFYAVMNLFAGPNILVSVVLMRIVTALLFVALTTALFVLLPAARRQTLVLMWMITTVPLGIFLLASNNPSSWAVIGIGSAWIALLGYFESAGRRKIALGALFALSVVMAAGSRGDAAAYSVVAIGAVGILKIAWTRRFWLEALLPIAMVIVSAVFFLISRQTASGENGFGGSSGPPTVGGTGGAEQTLHGFGLFAYDLLNAPSLWAGVFGSWPLGWLDTPMPAVVSLGALAVFVAIGFVGFRQLGWRKAVVLALIALVLWLLPVYVLVQGGDTVGNAVQPRYLLPLVVLAGGMLLVASRGRQYVFGRGQIVLVVVVLSVVNLIALELVIRRFVTGNGDLGLNLDTGDRWWWGSFPFSPNVVWILGSLAFAATLVVLARELLRSQRLAAQADATALPITL
ncbi:MAG TPA: DUF2142 domain-containing protein [Galbitalea sp.]|jgi:hypothetical protein|nr:DUF2142 domain-containing protein [Galbitalea sp.]